VQERRAGQGQHSFAAQAVDAQDQHSKVDQTWRLGQDTGPASGEPVAAQDKVAKAGEQRQAPAREIVAQQFPFAAAPGVVLGMAGRGASASNLQADEFGPGRIAVLLQPVGEDEPGTVVGGMFDDVGLECRLG
jgi:hypothetical protein